MSGKKGLKKGSEKRSIQSPSGMNGNVLDGLHLLNSIKNGKESKSFPFLWNQQKKRILIHDFAHFFSIFLFV